MCWPSVEGGIEVEERYPRTNDPREPRQKRLNFVRKGSSRRRDSDDYALMHSTFNQARPIRREMQERHDPRMLERQHHQMQQLTHQNQDLQWRNHQLEQERQHAIQQQQQFPPPPPPPHLLGGHHPQDQGRIPQFPHQHEGYPAGEEFHPHAEPHYIEREPRMIERRPRSRMPSYVRTGRGRSPSQGRHGGYHSGNSVYSDDTHRSRHHRGRSPSRWGSSHDSFDDLLPTHNPGIRRVISRPHRHGR